MGIDAGNRNALHSEINVTPLVDVVLVLLIIFMVVLPLAMRGYDLDIPGESTLPAPAQDRPEQFVLAIRAAGCPATAPPPGPGLPGDCRVSLNDETVEVAELAGRVAEIMAPRVEPVLFLACDAELNYEAVMRIIDAARSRVDGLRIGMVTDDPA